MRNRRRLDREELRLTAPRPAVLAGLVPDPEVPQPARVPAELDGRAGSRVADPRTPFRKLRDREQAASRTVERPPVAALVRTVEEQDSGPTRRGGRRERWPVRLAELVGQSGGNLDLDLGLEELQAERDVLEGDERGRLERLDVQSGQHLGTGELERAHEREPVTSPREARGRGLGGEDLPGIVRGASVEAVLDVSDAT